MVSCVTYRVGKIVVVISACILYLNMAYINERHVLSSASFFVKLLEGQGSPRSELIVFSFSFGERRSVHVTFGIKVRHNRTMT